MFGHNRNGLPHPYDYSSELLGQFPLPADTTAQPTLAPSALHLSPLAIPNQDSVSALRSEIGYTSSGCCSYGGSPSSVNGNGAFSPCFTASSHSFQRSSELYPSIYAPSPRGYFESGANSVRKVLSTGDLQGVSLAQNSQRLSSPLANESSIIESMNRALPYSPEEKKERIERYRSKRNLRNFNKKIKYECRKTLADSRPRIRGRFARNDEKEKTPQSQWDHAGVEEDEEEEEAEEEDDENWINFLDTYSANLIP